MLLKDITQVVKAKVLTPVSDDILNMEIGKAFASDLMSDVLCYLRDVEDNVLLITGLTNLQIVHTASTIDIKAILVVRGKTVEEHVIEAAKDHEISIFVTDETLFSASGKIYCLENMHD